MQLDKKIIDQYMIDYPNDSASISAMRNDTTFNDLHDAINNGTSVYKVLFIDGSKRTETRENIFNELAEMLGVDYQNLLDRWIAGE